VVSGLVNVSAGQLMDIQRPDHIRFGAQNINEQIGVDKVYLPYAIGLIFYCASVFLSYSDKMKASPWFFPLGLLFAAICNFIWLYIAKNTVTKHDIYMAGLLWDSMIVGPYVLIPVLCFGVRFAPLNMLGVAMVIAGIILTKV